MKREWENPEVKNLKVVSTEDSGCPYESEAAGEASTMTLFPVFQWGDGKIGCTYWNSSKHGCTNPNYGRKGTCWPCPPAPADSVSNS